MGVSEGGAHGCALRKDTDHWYEATCWGLNNYGQATAREDMGYREIRTGFMHTCGIRMDSRVECWGAGKTNTGSDYNFGQSIPPTGTFIGLSAGYTHTCGLRPNGAIECWGKNTSGESTAPAGQFVSVEAGNAFSCGVRADGSTLCWGTPQGFDFHAFDARFLRPKYGKLPHKRGIKRHTQWLDKRLALDGGRDHAAGGLEPQCGRRAFRQAHACRYLCRDGRGAR